MRTCVSEGGHLVHSRSVKLVLLWRRDQWGLPQNILSGNVTVVRSANPGLSAQQAQVSPVVFTDPPVEGRPYKRGHEGERSLWDPWTLLGGCYPAPLATLRCALGPWWPLTLKALSFSSERR